MLALAVAVLAAGAAGHPLRNVGRHEAASVVKGREAEKMLRATAVDYADTYVSPVTEHATMQLWWLVDEEESQFWLRMRLEPKKTTNEHGANLVHWVGFGISNELGEGMVGADIVMAYIDPTGTAHAFDSFSTAYSRPITDTIQDWDLVSAVLTDNGVLDVEVSRALATDDCQDHLIHDFIGNYLWAWGSIENGEFQQHDGRGVFTRNFFGDVDIMSDPDVDYVDLHVDEFEMPPANTLYPCQSFQLPFDESDPPYHGIRFETLYTSPFVHHLVVRSCSAPVTERLAYSCGECTEICEPVWVSGPSAGFTNFPEQAGIPLGVDGVRYITLFFHYSNPEKLRGFKDSSGIRIYYTSKLREHDAWLMLLSDPHVRLMFFHSLMPNQHDIHVPHVCPSGCTSTWEHEIFVFGVSPHMHKVGARQTFEVWNGDNLKSVVVADYFDFNVQKLAFLDRHLQISPGDEILTNFHFDTSSRSKMTKYGPNTDDEMTITYMMYYPRLRRNVVDRFGAPVYDDETGEQKKLTFSECGYVNDNMVQCGPRHYTTETLVHMPMFRPSSASYTGNIFGNSGTCPHVDYNRYNAHRPLRCEPLMICLEKVRCSCPVANCQEVCGNLAEEYFIEFAREFHSYLVFVPIGSNDKPSFFIDQGENNIAISSSVEVTHNIHGCDLRTAVGTLTSEGMEFTCWNNGNKITIEYKKSSVLGWGRLSGITDAEDLGNCLPDDGGAPTEEPVAGSLIYGLSNGTPFKLRWTMVEDDVIEITMEAETQGYIGIGFNTLHMKDADMVIGMVYPDGRVVVDDYYSIASGAAPTPDVELGGTSGIISKSGSEVGGVTTITFQRKLKGGDEYDSDIHSGPANIIFAVGQTDALTYHTARDSASVVLVDHEPIVPSDGAGDSTTTTVVVAFVCIAALGGGAYYYNKKDGAGNSSYKMVRMAE